MPESDAQSVLALLTIGHIFVCIDGDRVSPDCGTVGPLDSRTGEAGGGGGGKRRHV